MANSARPGPVLALATAFVLAGCGAIGGTGPSATLCPPATLESVTVDTKTVATVTYAVLIDRAYTGDAKRSPSYPWPQLPRTALETVAAALPKLDLRPGDAVMGAWISHNSNQTSEIFLPISQVKRAPTPDLPAAPTAPKLPLNKLECNEYAAGVRTFNEAATAWRAKVTELQQAAIEQDQRNVASFVAATSAAISAAAPAQDPVGTDIYGGLAVASGVFTSNPGIHKLVVFSDMTDTIGNPVRNLVGALAIVLRVPAQFTRTDVDPALRRVAPSAPNRFLRSLRGYFGPVLDRPARTLGRAIVALFGTATHAPRWPVAPITNAIVGLVSPLV